MTFIVVSDREVEWPPSSSKSSPAGAHCLPRALHVTTRRSRSAPTTVRSHPSTHGSRTSV